jgi:NADPH-dependent 2,4-dienoyl-CoA reductase/sulfur reductase-like enzyme
MYDAPSLILRVPADMHPVHLALAGHAIDRRSALPILARMSGQREIDVLVVGSGAAGMLAAVTAAEAGQRTVLLTKGQAARSGATAAIIGGCSVDGRTCVDLLGLTPMWPEPARKKYRAHLAEVRSLFAITSPVCSFSAKT